MMINLEGLIPLIGGVYALLMAYGKVSIGKDPVKAVAWKNRWATPLKWLAPVVIIFGLLQLANIV